MATLFFYVRPSMACYLGASCKPPFLGADVPFVVPFPTFVDFLVAVWGVFCFFVV